VSALKAAPAPRDPRLKTIDPLKALRRYAGGAFKGESFEDLSGSSTVVESFADEVFDTLEVIRYALRANKVGDKVLEAAVDGMMYRLQGRACVAMKALSGELCDEVDDG
jgi:hypothetical protein